MKKIKVIKNPFARGQNIAVTMLCVVFLLFFAVLSCGKQQPEHDCHPELGYGAMLRLKPQADENYSPMEDPEIQALLLKHGLGMRQTSPGAINPELRLDYTLTIETNRKCWENYIEEFLATGKFEDEVYLYEPAHPLNINL